MHEHVEEGRGIIGIGRGRHLAQRVLHIETSVQPSEQSCAPFRFLEQGRRLTRELACRGVLQRMRHLVGACPGMLQQQHVHTVGHLQHLREKAYRRVLAGEQAIGHMVVEHDLGIAGQRRELLEEQVAIERMLPHGTRLELHEPVDFLGAVGADVVHERHEARVATPCRLPPSRLEHGVHDRAHPQAVIHQPGIHAVERPLDHHGRASCTKVVGQPDRMVEVRGHKGHKALGVMGGRGHASRARLSAHGPCPAGPPHRCPRYPTPRRPRTASRECRTSWQCRRSTRSRSSRPPRTRRTTRYR